MQIYSTVALVSTQEASKKRAIFQKKKKNNSGIHKELFKTLRKDNKNT